MKDLEDGFILDDFLPYRLAVLAGRVSRDFAGRYGVQFGLSIAQWRVLAHLSQHDKVSVRELHRRVDMEKSKVSRACTRLENDGLITKRAAAQDRRLLELSLTPTGLNVVARIVPLAAEYEAALLHQLSAVEREQFCQCLTKLLNHTA